MYTSSLLNIYIFIVSYVKIEDGTMIYLSGRAEFCRFVSLILLKFKVIFFLLPKYSCTFSADFMTAVRGTASLIITSHLTAVSMNIKLQVQDL